MQSQFLEIITAAFTAGETKPYAFNGGYFEVLDCVYPVNVQLIGRNGEIKGIMRNAEASFYLREGDYQTIVIESPQAQTVRFAYGSSEAGTRRTAGIVQVVDGSRAIVESGASFMTFIGVAGVAAMVSQLQLWNPPGSGKKLIVKSLFLTSSVNVVYGVSFSNVALPTLSPSSPPKNKLFGSPIVTVAEARTRNNTAVVEGTGLGPAVYVLANDSKSFMFNEPLIVPPGYGLNVACANVNNGVNASLDFYEVEI